MGKTSLKHRQVPNDKKNSSPNLKEKLSREARKQKRNRRYQAYCKLRSRVHNKLGLKFSKPPSVQMVRMEPKQEIDSGNCSPSETPMFQSAIQVEDFHNLRDVDQPVMVGLQNNKVFLPPFAGDFLMSDTSSELDFQDPLLMSPEGPQVGEIGCNLLDMLPGFRPPSPLPTLSLSPMDDHNLRMHFEPEKLILDTIEVGLWH